MPLKLIPPPEAPPSPAPRVPRLRSAKLHREHYAPPERRAWNNEWTVAALLFAAFMAAFALGVRMQGWPS